MNAKGSKLGTVARLLLGTVLLLTGMLLPARGVSSTPLADTIAAAPTSGPPGTLTLVTGTFSGYGPFDTVSLYWDTLYTGRHLGSTSLRSDGTFALPVVVPPEASEGVHQIFADVNAGYAQASTPFTVTTPTLAAAYIYDADVNTAEAFKDLLVANGVNTTLVPLSQVADTDFSPYHLILVGNDTGGGYDWSGSDGAREKIQGSGKPILGLGGGGASLFQELDLFIKWGQGWTALNRTDINVVDPNDPIWSLPYRIPIDNRLVTLYDTPNTHVAIYMPSPLANVLPVGRQSDNDIHYPLIEEDGRYFLWGFYAGPDSMSQTGKDVFVNVVWSLIERMKVDTLILTDYGRMEDLGYAHADVVDLTNDVSTLVGTSSDLTNMTALHRDLSDHAPSDLQTTCANWEGNEGSVEANNACVTAIDGYIEHLKQAAYPNLSYLIIVGANEVIPMKAREQDHLFSAQERFWGANLPDPDSYIRQLYSTPGQVNGWGHYLTDSIYGDLSYVDDGWGDQHELVPELAVGRLVETPSQIGDLIDTYLASYGRFSRADQISIASSDYLDGGTLAADWMGTSTDDDLVQCSYDSNDVPPKLNAGSDLVYFGGHGDYNAISTSAEAFYAGDHPSYGDTAALNDLPNAVIVTSGCHNGASFGNQLYHAPDAGTTYSEFPEEFAEREVGIYVGATGYTAISSTGCSTDTSGTRHNEKLSTYIIQHLAQDGCITAGEAFRRAVNSYVTDVGGIGTVERRVIAITTLYGIPNYRARCFLLPPWSWDRYWLRPEYLDPPPYLEPGILRYRVELRVPEWTIHKVGSEWYLKIPGAGYGGRFDEPPFPVFKAWTLLPPGSAVTSVEWDQAASQSTTWVADGAMYVPPSGDGNGQGMVRERFEADGLYPTQPYSVYTTTAASGAGTLAGLAVIPLQHDPNTLTTTLWTRMVFTVTCQTGASTDADGDGLPTYWEVGRGLDPNDATGDNGASGDPDGDGLTNEQEFDRWTDPLDADTDDDGWQDGEEVARNTDPLNPGSHPRLLFLPLILRGG